MSAESKLQLAEAYMQIVPSMRGTQGVLAKELGGVEGAGAKAGARLGAGMGGGLKGRLRALVPGLGASTGGALGGAVLGVVGKFAAPIAAAVAGFAVAKEIHKSVEAFEGAASATLGLQRVIGGTTGQVSGLTAALQLSGVDATGSGTALRIFSKNMGNAATNAKAGAKITKELGFSFKDAHGQVLPMATLLPKVSDRFKSMPDGPAKTALAMQLFGRSGASMLPFLNRGAAGIADLTSKAKGMGLVLDDTSIRIFKEGRKSAREWTAAISGAHVAVGQDFAPALESVANIGRKAAAPVLGMLARVAVALRPAFLSAAEVVDRVAEAIGGKSSAMFGRLGKVLVAAAAPVNRFMEALSKGKAASGPLAALGGALHAIGSAFSAALAPALPAIGQLVRSAIGLYTHLSPVGLGLHALLPVLPAIAKLLGVVAGTIGGALGHVLTALLPVVTQVSGVLVHLATGVLAQLIPVVATVAVALAGALGKTLVMLSPVIGAVVRALGSLLTQGLGLLGPVIGTVVGLLGHLLTTQGGFLTAVLSLLPPIATLVGHLLVGLVPVLTHLASALFPVVAQVLGVVARVIGSVLAAVLPLVGTLLHALMPVVLALLPVFGQLAAQVLPLVVGALALVIKAVLPVVTVLLSTLMPVIRALLPVVTAVFSAIVPIITAALQVVKGVVQVVTGLISGNWSLVWTGIKNVLAGVWGLIVGVVRGAIGIVWAVIKAGVALVGVAWRKGWELLGTLLKAAWSIVTGLLGKLLGGVGRMIGGAVSGYLGAWAHGWQQISDFVGGAWSKIAGAVSAGIGKVVAFAKGIAGKILAAVAGYDKLLFTAGANLLHGLIGGVQSIVKTVISTVTGMATNVVNTVKHLFGIKSPSRVFAAIGTFLGLGLIKGIQGTHAQVQSAMAKLSSLTTAAFAKGTVSQATETAVTRMVRLDTRKLDALAARRDSIASRLKAAQSKLTAALTTRNDYASSVSSGVAGLANVTSVSGATNADGSTAAVTASDIVGNLQRQVASTARFTSELTKLKAAGLNSTTYKQLVDAFAQNGDTSAADALAAGGSGAVKQVNSLQGQLVKQASLLGKTSSTALYQAGVNSAQGLANGLAAQSKSVTKAMDRLAEGMVSAIKKKLKIKSPSRRFHDEVGVQIGAGLADGVESTYGRVGRSVTGLVALPRLPKIGLPVGAGAAGTGLVQNFNGPMGYTADELAAKAAAKARRALRTVNVPKVVVR